MLKNLLPYHWENDCRKKKRDEKVHKMYDDEERKMISLRNIIENRKEIFDGSTHLPIIEYICVHHAASAVP